MHDEEKANAELFDELTALREKVTMLEGRYRKCRQNEKKLLEEKELTDAALNAQLDTFFVLDISTGKALNWNRAFRDISGYSDAQIREMKAPDSYYSAEDLHKAEQIIQTVRSQGQAVVELSLLTRDGRRIPMEYTVASINDWAGRPQYLIAIGRDVSLRKQFEKALGESEKRFRALFDAMIEGVALHELLHDELGNAIDYRILNVNPAYLAHTGIRREDAVGRKASELYGTGTPPYFDVYCDVVRSGTPVRFESYFEPMQKHFSISVFSPTKGQFATVFQDISERKRSEEALRENEARFGSIIENTEAGYFFIDRYGIIQDVNSSWVKLYKYSSIDEVLGQHFTMVQNVDDVEKAKEFVEGIMHGDSRCLGGEFSRKCKDGSIGYHSFSARPVYHKGEVIGIEGFIIDVTEHRKAEEELQKYREHLEVMVAQRTSELEAANAELKSFAYVVSHDLKAPLRGIGHLAQWLVDDYGDTLDEKGKEMSDLLVGRVTRMDKLIDGILHYSRIGRIVGKDERIDLNTLLLDVIDALAPPMHIRISINGELPTIMGDKLRIFQIFQNLLSNAITFLDKPRGEIFVYCISGDDGLLTFCVADNGPGIEKRFHERIFQVFQTLQPRDQFESTGIGLSLVKKIVELYGGTIWLESEPGQGTEFFFTLPKALL